MFEIIGVVLMSSLCGWATFVGVAGNYVTFAFSGKLRIASTIVGILGAIGIYFLIVNAPFSITMVKT